VPPPLAVEPSRLALDLLKLSLVMAIRLAFSRCAPVKFAAKIF
jgi:hypothetical protein